MSRRAVAAVADSGPVLVLASIAAAGSFTHIRDTAAEHGQHGWMAWAIAVCIDLTCVMAARERQRDKRTQRRTARLSWPTLVLVGGILLSLAANLAQAEPSVWGWLSAATPAGAFLVAVSMLERRASAPRPEPSPAVPSAVPSPEALTVPPSFGRPAEEPPSPAGQDEQTKMPIPATEAAPPATRPAAPPATRPAASSAAGPGAPLLDFARRVAAEHQERHGRPITRDALRGRLGVSNQLASDLLRQLRVESPA